MDLWDQAEMLWRQRQRLRQDEVISDQWSVISGQYSNGQFINPTLQSFSPSVHQIIITSTGFLHDPIYGIKKDADQKKV